MWSQAFAGARQARFAAAAVAAPTLAAATPTLVPNLRRQDQDDAQKWTVPDHSRAVQCEGLKFQYAYPPAGLAQGLKELPDWIKLGCGMTEYYCEEKKSDVPW